MKKYLKTADSDWYKYRITWAMLWVTAAFVILIARLLYLQVIEGKELRRLSENNCIRLQNIDPPRGLIFDCNGELLVDNRPSFDLSIVLKDAEPIEQTIVKLSQYIHVPASVLWSKIGGIKGISSYNPVLLKQDIGRDALAVIEAHKFDLPGVVVNVNPKRHYLNKQSASHLIGYLGEISADELKSGKYFGRRSGDFIGKFGVEKAYEQLFSGNRGGQQVEVNVTGQVVRILKTVPARPGNNIYLTIEHVLQKRAEELLEGMAGAVVAMEPSTGSILALVSSPAFDQNTFVNGMSHEQWNSLISNPFRPMENKVVQGEYPPASVFKIITAMAALEEKIIDENTAFYCPGYHEYGDRVFRCWKKDGHGRMDIYKALTESCDVFFYQVARMLEVDRLAWYAKACGLGSPTGVNLDHEAQGLVPTAAWKKGITGNKWQKGETLGVAIGQGYNLVTPLQVLVLASALANGGTIYKPLIIKTIETAEGEMVYSKESHAKGTLPASRPTLKIIKKSLWGVVNNNRGTGWIARIDGINISGKTGTAEVVSRTQDDSIQEEERKSQFKPHAWFMAYAPSDDPQIAVVVLIEHGGHGSSSAAPIARELIKTYLSIEG